MWGSLKKAWAWIVAGLLALLGAGWVWHRHTVGKLQDRAALAEASARVRELRAKREALDVQAEGAEAELAKLDLKIALHREKARRAFEVPWEITNEQLEQALKDVLR